MILVKVYIKSSAYYEVMTDEELADKTIRGNVNAYEELMVRYEFPVLRYVIYLVHDKELAEDILQETFIKAFRNMTGFDTKRKFSSWLYRIAHNTAMDALRKNRPVVISEDPDLGKYATVEPAIAEKLDKEILAHDIGRCLAGLAQKYKAPLLLHYYQQKSYKDISDILRIPSATVGVRINRAKILLRSICQRLEVKP